MLIYTATGINSILIGLIPFYFYYTVPFSPASTDHSCQCAENIKAGEET